MTHVVTENKREKTLRYQDAAVTKSLRVECKDIETFSEILDLK